MMGVMSRRRPRPTPQPVPPTPSPTPSPLDFLAQNFLSSSQRRADDIVKYGGPYSGLGSRTADLAVGAGVKDSPLLRAGALAGDIVFDPANLIGVPGGVAAAKTAAPRVAPLLQGNQAYGQALVRRALSDPETAVITNRGLNSAEDIIAGSGRFKNVSETGTTAASSGGVDYTRLRDIAEGAMGNQGAFSYGVLDAPVLRNIPAPFGLGTRGRERQQMYDTVRRMFPDAGAISYGPVSYKLTPEATQRAGIYFGDSLYDVQQSAGALRPRSITDVLADPAAAQQADIGNVGKNFVPYIEASIPNLSINDVASIRGVQGIGRAGMSPDDMARLRSLVERSGRDIPVSSITPTQIPIRPTPTPLSQRLQNRFQPRRRSSGGQTLNPFDDL